MFNWLQDKFSKPVEPEIVYITRDASAEEARAQARLEVEVLHNQGRRDRGLVELFSLEYK